MSQVTSTARHHINRLNARSIAHSTADPADCTEPSPLHCPTLYVSPCGRHFTADAFEANGLASDLTQLDDDDIRRVYRRLDADWFAWLVLRTAHAVRLVQSGEIQGDQAKEVDAIRRRLGLVRAWAIKWIGREPLRAAINRGVSPRYRAPKVFSHANSDRRIRDNHHMEADGEGGNG